MNRVFWGAAVAVVAFGIGAILLLPDDLPKADLSGMRDAPPPAAIPAMLVVEQVSPIVGPDGTLAESLGIETAGGVFTPVLPMGTRAPVMRYVTFRTSADNQSEMRLHILRGLADRVARNHDLGWVRVTGLPSGPRGAVQVTVGFRIADGAVVLAAGDPTSGRGYAIETSEAPPGFPR